MRRSCLVLLVSVALAAPVIAQPGRSSLPSVGDTLPAVTVFDGAGDEFSTASLRGQYSVLVFGCLT